MPIEAHGRRESTVTFLPHRLNRQPVIVRGLTADELWITVSVSAACGLSVGIVLAILLGSFPLAPTMAVAFVALGLFAGGGLLRRLKRGRPDTWLYRQMQCRLAQRVPTVSPYFGASDLIVRSGVWTTRRSSRP